jgi:CheY-like chemotaxis protein
MSTPFRKVLLVDDDPTTNFLNRIVLERSGVAEQVVERDNGLTALEYVKRNCIHDNVSKEGCLDLILLDINMPVMSGPEFLVELAKIEQADKIVTKVVVLSSSSLLKDQHLIGKYQVIDFIQKPLTAEKVDFIVRKATSGQ